jgi:hypothetical protein
MGMPYPDAHVSMRGGVPAMRHVSFLFAFAGFVTNNITATCTNGTTNYRTT